MILDAGLILDDAVAIAGTSKASGTYIDQLSAGASLGDGGWFVSQISGVFTSGTSIKVTLQHDSDAAFGTVTTLVDGPVLALADASKVGTQLLVVKIPPNAKRYIRCYYTIVGTYDSASAVDSFVTLHPDVILK